MCVLMHACMHASMHACKYVRIHAYMQRNSEAGLINELMKVRATSLNFKELNGRSLLPGLGGTLWSWHRRAYRHASSCAQAYVQACARARSGNSETGLSTRSTRSFPCSTKLATIRPTPHGVETESRPTCCMRTDSRSSIQLWPASSWPMSLRPVVMSYAMAHK